MSNKIAVITGASSGIGEKTAIKLASDGFKVILGARRADRLEALAKKINGIAIPLDVTNEDSVKNFVNQIDGADVLINNAGGARGLDFIADANLEHWKQMWELNVLGTLRITKALLPKLLNSPDSQIITITSISALDIYDKGAGYTSSKFAQGVISRTLRSELIGKPIRISEICPGAVETEFSLKRFSDDEEKASEVYRGMTPLIAEDVADIISYVVNSPSHVNFDQIIVKPRDQISVSKIHRV